jgi:branched-chain amino acid transport system ATP-binding protein
VGLVPQGRRLFGDLTARENLVLAAGRRPPAEYQWHLEDIYQLFPRLHERERTAAGQLSGGEQQMLAIGRALMTNPKVLLLDEPSEGLAPMLVRQVGDVLQSLRQRGLTILLVEQNLALAVAVADRVYIMNKGRIVFEDAAGGLLADEEAKSRWLGV